MHVVYQNRLLSYAVLWLCLLEPEKNVRTVNVHLNLHADLAGITNARAQGQPSFPCCLMQNLLVAVVLNLKPAKLAGEKSEAMILAADAEVGGKVIVKTLQPPGERSSASCLHRLYVYASTALHTSLF